jgi:hypothetical protein
LGSFEPLQGVQMEMDLIVIIIGIIVVAVAVGLTWKYVAMAPRTENSEQLASLDWYFTRLKQLGYLGRILRTGQVTLSAVAIIASVLAASRWKAASLPDGLLSVLAAVSIAVLTGLDLSSQANNIRNAERHLTFAILKHCQKNGEDATLDDVRNAYEEAEKIIGDYRPQVGK